MQAADILQERYQIKKKIGDNAGRKTWLATDIQSSPPSPVIVKLIAFNPQIQWNDLKLFEREAQVLKNINHPKIPQYRDYFSVDDVEGSGLRWFGLVQEYIPGDSLKQLLDKGFKEKDVYSIATQILQILIHLHELSPPVIHRDIKPSNLILGKDNQIYLVDFGAVQDKAKAEGATFTVVGTSGYAPPEQLWGKAVPTSDLYALGATLIHLLTEIAPAELPQNQMRIQFKERVTINPEFANWIEQLIQPAPERRFSTARQALIALQALIAFQHSQSRIRKNESVSRANTPDYCLALLCALFSGFLLIFFLLTR
jgi:serine/threonine protein kinase